MQKIMTNKEYHAEADHISCSGVKAMLKSPWHFKHQPEYSTDALAFGSLFHTLTLEPDKVKDEFIIQPVFNKRTNVGKEQAKEFAMSNKDKTIVDAGDYDNASRMALAARSTGFFDKGEAELSIFSTLNGCKVKIRPDFLSEDRTTYYELKSARDETPRLFGYAFRDYRYDIQDAMYYEVLKNEFPTFERVVFVVVGKTKDAGVELYEVGDRTLATNDVFSALETWKTCKEFDIWPGKLIDDINILGVNVS